MIRRNVPLAESPNKWLLVSQVEHARISAELAEAWGGGNVANVVCEGQSADLHLQQVRQELLTAILHHDDGWATWEASPEIDPAHARPYSFMELPRSVSLPLWRDSVLRGRQFGPLAGWVVAGHFQRLLEESNDAHCALSEAWLAEVVAWRRDWLTEWQSLNRPVHTRAIAQECLDWLRLFDWLSLWLCCYCPSGDQDQPTKPMILEEGQLAATHVSVVAQTSAADGACQVTVAPWPFRKQRVELDALGYAVPAKAYATSGDIAKSRSPMRLRWRLTPE